MLLCELHLRDGVFTFEYCICNWKQLSGLFFFYKSAEEREKLVKAERKFIEDRVKNS